MNVQKQQRKIIKAQTKAEACLSRDEARKILSKYEKAQVKIKAAHLLGG